MNQGERLKRDPPQRSGPIRNMSMAFRPATPPVQGPGRVEEPARPDGPARPASPAPDAGSCVQDALEKGVATAYRVIEDYMKRGINEASRQSSSARMHPAGAMPFAGAMPPPMGYEMQNMAFAAMQFWSGLAQMWLGAMAPGMQSMPGMFRGPPDWGNIGPVGQGAASSAPQPPAAQPVTKRAAEKLAVSVDVSSVQPAEVTLQLHDRSATKDLMVMRLSNLASDAQLPQSAVRIETQDGHLRVRVTVPHDQPPGVYLGVVVDKARSEDRGTIRVAIRPQP